MVVASLVACQSQDTPNVIRPELASDTEVQARPAEKKPVQKKRRPKKKPVVTVKPLADRPFVPGAPGLRVSHVNVPGKYVAITFDDGPSSAYTPKLLDILKQHGARATFYVLGENANRHKSILARAVAEGHEIGNHTYSHIKMTAKSQQSVAKEIERTNAAIKNATGYSPTTMRPPYGAINKPLVNAMYNNYGFHSVLWDVDTKDWQHPGVSVVVNRAVNQARSGSIILLHDIHASTLAAVEQVITGLQARGFKLVTVSKLIELGKRAAEPVQPQLPTEASPLPQQEPTTPGEQQLPAEPTLPEGGLPAIPQEQEQPQPTELMEQPLQEPETLI